MKVPKEDLQTRCLFSAKARKERSAQSAVTVRIFNLSPSVNRAQHSGGLEQMSAHGKDLAPTLVRSFQM